MKIFSNNESQSIIWLLLFFTLTLVHALPEYGYIFELSTSSSSFVKKHLDNNIKLRYLYDSDIFNGVSLEFASKDAANRFIQQHPDIVNFWPIMSRTHIQAAIKHEQLSSFIPQNKDTIRQLTKENYAYKRLKLTGSGIKVGIIDSGVDYTHPALGGCFGKGCKVAYGYDLVGNDFNGTIQSIHPDDDPLDDCPSNSTSATGHGTFVAGIIAAEDKKYDWTGVAPGVTLGMWRVYSCNYAIVPDDILIKAMDMAYKAGMDVINLSLGSFGGWEETVLSRVASSIVSKGVHVIAANGNIGSSGIFLPSSPATGKDVISVGSIQNEYVPGYVLKVYAKQTLSISYRTYVNSALKLNKKLPIASASTQFNKKQDACRPLKDSNRFRDSILLIHLGGCSPLDQIKHAKQAGAEAVIFYSDTVNATTEVQVLTSSVLPLAFINNDEGYRIFSVLDQEKKVKAQFTNTLVALSAPSNDILHQMSGFSTLGPTNELELKPEIMGVGGNVFSTFPQYKKSYGFLSGSSMAAPFVSGQVALLLEKKKLSPKETKNILMNFATQVRPPISDLQYGDSPIRQGAGVVDVAQATRGLGLFHALPTYLSFNDSAHFKQRQTITFYNHDLHALVIELSHQPSLTATGYSAKSNDTPSEPVGLYSRNHSVSAIHFSKRTLTIPPGQSASITVQLEPPTDTFSESTHAIYGGYIIASAKGGIEASVPYLGMIGNMKDLPILDHLSAHNSFGFPFPAIGYPSGNATVEKGKLGHFTLRKQGNQTTGGPFVVARLLTGTPLLQIQVIKNNKVIGDVPFDDSVGPHRTWLQRNTLTFTESSYPYYSWQWNGNYIPKDATLKDTNEHEKSQVKSGIYQLKIRALKVFGDKKNKHDWDEWISPKFMLKV
ncbi:subtilisin-like protein [Rhizopus microsporus ATCC 52813]|uniref:Subtilisin-like protein n=1 Tax=Rhizopus microsporus ATCC 52813 TaxID=1340429 RepID=A0A2G4T084_RHIZD|nr:subtilisin-like protein [Rhizopus microsporus ATCC 52813]PHZ14411.1 subtilisin-like protein [Rhizopus microsporus ATCC 52813]